MSNWRHLCRGHPFGVSFYEEQVVRDIDRQTNLKPWLYCPVSTYDLVKHILKFKNVFSKHHFWF